MPAYHLAQINIAHLKAPIDDPLIADFVADLDRINYLAEQSDGFIWRLMDEVGNATSYNLYNDPSYIINMSVWRDVKALKTFVYKSDHVNVYMKRVEWFHPMKRAHMALWWVSIRHEPTLDEAVEKLNLIDRIGTSKDAFTFRNIYEPYK
ncbi:MAG: hypothetical protein ACI9FN_002810 [Saprospiraceae bacterium]|jgi:hypothetical protein